VIRQPSGQTQNNNRACELNAEQNPKEADLPLEFNVRLTNSRIFWILNLRSHVSFPSGRKGSAYLFSTFECGTNGKRWISVLDSLFACAACSKEQL
jgi:hypothetical protein